MQKLSDLLIELTRLQRLGLFVAAFALIGIIFLHNPIGGYYLTYESNYAENNILYPSGNFPSSECPLLAQSTYNKDMSQEIKDVAFKKMQEFDCFGTHFLPFSEWQSNDPFVSWLGSVIHMLWAASLVVVLAFVWVFLFRSDSGK